MDVRTTEIQSFKSLTKNRGQDEEYPCYISHSLVDKCASHQDSRRRDKPKHPATGSVGWHVITWNSVKS